MKKLLRQARWALLGILPIWPIYYLAPKLFAHGSSAAFDMGVAAIIFGSFWVVYCLIGAWTES